MKVQLITKIVHKASINAIENKDTKSSDKQVKVHVRLDNEIFENSKDKKSFKVRYIAAIKLEHRVEINVEYDFHFTSSEEINAETAKSSLFKSEIPSIAYPYLKVYVESMINLSGIGNYLLPYFDFYADPFE
ncbi:hypothetical protein [Rosenbergiella nectarea]|uniref:hypothetical protein n=1 Tax=Rosenbergiella nectarea TaxID=988801 RepID=UPI001F4DCA66|nr:hypothetical protein [Rosenbergiella nectarea]